MDEIHIRKEGQAGLITLAKPQALNALSADMSIAIENALDRWRDDEDVKLLIIDAEGDKAFCAGGDIVQLYEEGKKGHFAYGQNFWRQEYQMNYKMALFPKPVVSFMQGFVMGGGVGVGCHASHRIVGESSKVAMPECGIGLIPDVGGSRILAHAPDNFGVYLGLTGARMGAGDAILAGFADYYLLEDQWQSLKDILIESGSIDIIAFMELPPPETQQFDGFKLIKSCFEQDNIAFIVEKLKHEQSDFAAKALKRLIACSPISMACALKAIRSAKSMTLVEALAQEYRFTYRSMEYADFLEGIRAQVIDRDFSPQWKHQNFDVPDAHIEAMLAHLGDAELAISPLQS